MLSPPPARPPHLHHSAGRDPGAPAWSPTASSKDVFLDLQVKLRLVPTIAILRRGPADEHERARAERAARSALELAATAANAALMGRCCFYIACALVPLHRSPAHRASLLTYFNRALDAKDAGYLEASWAQRWLETLAHMYPDSVDDRPSSSGSWTGRILHTLSFGAFGDSPETQIGPRRASDGPSGGNDERSPASHRATSPVELAVSDKTPSPVELPDSSAAEKRRDSGLTLRGVESSCEKRPDLDAITHSPLTVLSAADGQPSHGDADDGKDDEADDEQEDEEEDHMPNHVLGGLINIQQLSPKTPTSSRSPDASSRSPDDASARSTPQHSRSRSHPSPPTEPSPGHGEDDVLAEGVSSGTSALSSRRLRASLSLMSPSLVRRKRSEIAQMEEGESPVAPAFAAALT